MIHASERYQGVTAGNVPHCKKHLHTPIAAARDQNSRSAPHRSPRLTAIKKSARCACDKYFGAVQPAGLEA
jgi:hypothetical protein